MFFNGGKSETSEIEDLKSRVQVLENAATAKDIEIARLNTCCASNERELNEIKDLLLLVYSKVEVPVSTSKNESFLPTENAIIDASPSNTFRTISLAFNGEPFDENGLLYLIGSQGKTAPYFNPHLLQVSGSGNGVSVSVSGVCDDSEPHRFVNHDEAESNYTDNVCGSWMMLDIGESRLMKVNHYCLRHGASGGDRALRNWLLQGSLSGGSLDKEWDTLKDHSNDNKLNLTIAYSTAHWPVDDSELNVGYRYFRILQTGKNWDFDDELVCSGIELYGQLKTKLSPC